MIINRLIAKNWRNFQQVNVPLRERQFIVGPNASGKSNLLDVFRFLRDIVKVDGGGFQKAVKDRGGVSNIQCLAAQNVAEVALEIHIAESAISSPIWKYAIGFHQEKHGDCFASLTHEQVWRDDELLLDRPDSDDSQDPDRLTQTALEQSATNAKFREIGKFLRNITYLHLVPQFIRHADAIQGKIIENDPFGQGFLAKVASVHPSTRRSRLKRIEQALKLAVPQFEKLEFVRDKITGQPHLQARYEHWHSNEAVHQEDQFSDGMLRFIGLMWSLLENDSIVLLEEPEISLNIGIVSILAPLISRMGRDRQCQMLVSTQSDMLLKEGCIDSSEVHLLSPTKEGTTVIPFSDFVEIRPLLENGFTIGEVVLSRTRSENVENLSLIE